VTTFNRKRLGLARKRRKMSCKALAEKAGISPITISRLENGDNEPDESTIKNLSVALDYPEGFFFEETLDEISVNSVSFRSLKRMSAKEREAAISAGEIGLDIMRWVDERFNLPEQDLIDFSSETNPDVASRLLRDHWGIGDKPIANLLKLFESKGIRVFSLTENTRTVDAYSFWLDETPFMFLNTIKTAERSIFDSSHELAHLVLHKHAGPKASISAEREADQFASSFLMPENDVKAIMPKFITTDIVINYKKRWKVSAMALAYRLNKLGMLSEWRYKSTCIELSKRGYRSGEPVGINREVSTIWKKIISNLWADKKTIEEMAKSLHLPVEEIQELIFSLISEKDVKFPNIKTTKLRVVK